MSSLSAKIVGLVVLLAACFSLCGSTVISLPPPPTATSLGGVYSKNCSPNLIQSINTDGTENCAAIATPVASVSLTFSPAAGSTTTLTHNLGNINHALVCIDSTGTVFSPSVAILGANADQITVGAAMTNATCTAINAGSGIAGPTGATGATGATGVTGATGGGSSCGISQTVYGSPARSYGSVYHNTSACTMHVALSTLNATSTSGNYDVYSDSSSSPSTKIVEVSQQNLGQVIAIEIVFQVLPGNYYKVTAASGSPGIDLWTETY